MSETLDPSKKNIKPLVTIVIPVYNDEEYISRALNTALNQSLKNIEIICVDDYSTDGTVGLIQNFVKKDARIKLIKQPKNSSAFQARYIGVKEARSDYILFLDGDDELHKDAAKLSYAQASKSNSDVVGFGSRVVRQDGSTSREFEKSLQPVYQKLIGEDIVSKLFEVNKPAQGSLWRYLFAKKLLLKAYGYFPDGQQLYRSNDLPISFLSIALAKKYTSIKNPLYIYHFYAGGSGSENFDLDKFKFYMKAIDSVNLLGDIVTENLSHNTKQSYYNARYFVIANILRQIQNNLPADKHQDAVGLLLDKIGLEEITYGMATFVPEILNTIREFLLTNQTFKKSKNIAIYTNNLATGGVQGVVVSQAKYLLDAGFNVLIILLQPNEGVFEIPTGVKVSVVENGPLYHRLRSFRQILDENNIDTVIDHNILYNFSWPFFSLVAKSLGNKLVAWIHSFALRPMTEGKTNGKFLIDNHQLIDDLVVLSKPDVSYWKSIDHKNVYYLPNPPSPLLLAKTENIKPKNPPKDHLKIVWFGRLQEATKRVYSLIDIATELKKLTNDFTLTIIGPESNDVKIEELRERVQERHLQHHVDVVGPKHGQELIEAFKTSHLSISTSIIEGYPLTFTEAQSYGLPIVIYDLPWLAVLEDNKGIIRSPQQDPGQAAQAILELFTNRGAYKKASLGSLSAAKSYLSYDFAKLYRQLLENRLPKQFSPDIDARHMGMFIEWTQLYFSDLVGGSGLTDISGALRQKDAEIFALKHSRAMKLGNTVAKPIRIAKSLKHNVAKRMNKR